MTHPSCSGNDSLKRIAAALGKPVADFFPPDRSVAAEPSSDPIAAEETPALMKAFGAITDPETRRLCLAYVQSIAQASS